LSFLEDQPEAVATLLAALIVLIGLSAWHWSTSLADTFLAAVSAAATAAAAVMIKEVSIGIRQLRFEALNRAYEALDSPRLKESVDRLSRLEKEYFHALTLCLSGRDISHAARLVRRPSIELNKAGYLVYRGFLDAQCLAEEFGGFVVKAFAYMRPLLICLRNSVEDPAEPWFMRRFALLAYVAAESYLAKNWKNYLHRLLLGAPQGALSPLGLQLYSYMLCRKLGGRNCIDYLPALPRSCLTRVDLVECSTLSPVELDDKIAECFNEAAEKLLRECGSSGLSLVWLNWLEEKLQAVARRLYHDSLPAAPVTEEGCVGLA